MEKKRNEPALVVLSGGQDSTTCLYWAKRKFSVVKAISFYYGQKHFLEIRQAEIIAQKANVSWELLQAGRLKGTSPLTNPDEKVAQYKSVEDLPGGVEATFIPGRNALFLTFAANYAYVFGITGIITGVGQTDYANYPDCRNEFINAMEKALSLALYGEENRLDIYTPLMFVSKKETVLLAKDLGCIDAMADTHTCYRGIRPACGKCHACLLRLRGFEEAGIKDPLEYTGQT